MQFDDLVASISATTFTRLLAAVETGKWPDGVALTELQRAHCLQLVTAYQARYCPSDEPFRVGADGQLVQKSKAEMRAQTLAEPGAIARFPLTDRES